MRKLMILVTLLTACGLRNNHTATGQIEGPPLANLSSPVQLKPTSTPAVNLSPEIPVQPASTMIATPESRSQGYLDFPYRYADAGNFDLQPGEMIMITWEDAPSGASTYELLFTPSEGEYELLIGIDRDDSDGVSVDWLVPEGLSGQFHGTALFEDQSAIIAGFSGYIYSGTSPPEGVCSVSASNIGPLDIYREPQSESEVFAHLVPGVYAEALQGSANGWYQVDATAARDPMTGAGAEGTGWVHEDQNVTFFGPCESLSD